MKKPSPKEREEPQKTRAKARYARPRLERYGDLLSLTGGGGGIDREAGGPSEPKSKVTGTSR